MMTTSKIRFTSKLASSSSIIVTFLDNENNESGRTIVVSGPSGSGKSTLLKRLFQNHPNQFGFSVSHTTRSPRPGESDGCEYHFVSRDQFKELQAKNQFLEWAEFSKNLYGTSLEAVQQVLAAGKMCILDIDLQGVKSVKRVGSHLHPRYVLIRPPTFEELRRRLLDRKTETLESLDLRLQTAMADLKFADENPNFYDLVLINDDLDGAYQKLESFIFDNQKPSQ